MERGDRVWSSGHSPPLGTSRACSGQSEHRSEGKQWHNGTWQVPPGSQQTSSRRYGDESYGTDKETQNQGLGAGSSEVERILILLTEVFLKLFALYWCIAN